MNDGKVSGFDGQGGVIGPSGLDRSVAQLFNELVDNTKIDKPAIFGDQDRQTNALESLEEGMIEAPDGTHRVSVKSLELARKWIGESEKDQEKKKQYLKVERASLTDALTGLQNRRYADDKIEMAIENLSEGGFGDGGIGFIMLDINDFKKVNDALGHEEGDAVLKVVTKTLQSHTRDYDICARWGGEEILVSISGKDLNERIMKKNWGPAWLDNVDDVGQDSVFNLIQNEIKEKLTAIDPKYFKADEYGYMPGTLSYGWSYLSRSECQAMGQQPDVESIMKQWISKADKSMYNNKGVIKSENARVQHITEPI
jgi:GGDEF domain-containing protein